MLTRMWCSNYPEEEQHPAHVWLDKGLLSRVCWPRLDVRRAMPSLAYYPVYSSAGYHAASLKSYAVYGLHHRTDDTGQDSI